MMDHAPQINDRVRYVGPYLQKGETVTGTVLRVYPVDPDDERLPISEWLVILKLDRVPAWWELDDLAANARHLEPLLPATEREKRLRVIVGGLAQLGE